LEYAYRYTEGVTDVFKHRRYIKELLQAFIVITTEFPGLHGINCIYGRVLGGNITEAITLLADIDYFYIRLQLFEFASDR